MPSTVTQYEILISCPGDIEGVIPLINSAVEKFNTQYSKVLSIRLSTNHWSYSSYNQSGGKAQDLLNKQFIHGCDAAIAIFWTRFGTPTDKYGSGTEEEIEDMLAAGKQVFMYFCGKSVDPSLLLDDNAREQYQKVKSFQKRYSDEGKGIYSSFISDDEFSEKLFAHISQHFLTTERIASMQPAKRSELQLKGILNGKLNDHFYISQFNLNTDRTSEIRHQSILNLYKKIKNNHVGFPNPYNPFMGKPVEFDKDQRDLILKYADCSKINIPDDFFSLGGLTETMLSAAAILGGHEYSGTPEEKRKIRQLEKLYDEIVDFSNWVPFENEYSRLNCIQLAISNTGTTFDEDIEVVLSVPHGKIVFPHELPRLDRHSARYIVKEFDISFLLGIPATEAINNYWSSEEGAVPHAIKKNLTPSGFPFTEPDYEEEFMDELVDSFEYDFFDNDDQDTIKLRIKYLKHNTAVAFPTVLFVSEPLSEIKFKITSKHNADEIHGTITIGAEDET